MAQLLAPRWQTSELGACGALGVGSSVTSQSVGVPRGSPVSHCFVFVFFFPCFEVHTFNQVSVALWGTRLDIMAVEGRL